MKDIITARLDVLEAAVLALARALPADTASAVRTHLAQRVALLQHPSPEADAAAAATLARLLGALSSPDSSHR